MMTGTVDPSECEHEKWLREDKARLLTCTRYLGQRVVREQQIDTGHGIATYPVWAEIRLCQHCFDEFELPANWLDGLG